MAGVSEELMLRDKSTGRWLKRIDEDFILSKNLVPSSFITVNNDKSGTPTFLSKA